MKTSKTFSMKTFQPPNTYLFRISSIKLTPLECNYMLYRFT